MTTPLKYPEIYDEIRRCPNELPASMAARLGFSAKTVGHVRARMIKAGVVKSISDKSGIAHPEIYEAIRNSPTEMPVVIAANLGVSARLVGHVRARMIVKGEVQNILTRNLKPITDEERTVILGLRKRGFSYPAIGQKMGRSKGAIERLCNNARDAGELKPIVYQPREAVQCAIEMVEKPRLPRLGLNMTEAEERAVASLQNSLRNKTKLELLTMVRGRMRK
jgi:hypothetical protein